MKIFIAGARSIKKLDTFVQRKLFSIYQHNYSVLVGDCYGVDASVQKFYASLSYGNVRVYASNGKARNNIGRWGVQNVAVPSYVCDFDFYKWKDKAMADEADYGFMIWDCQSRGTLNNIINLVKQSKPALVYLDNKKQKILIKTFDDLNYMIDFCHPKTQAIYHTLLSNVTY